MVVEKGLEDGVPNKSQTPGLDKPREQDSYLG